MTSKHEIQSVVYPGSAVPMVVGGTTPPDCPCPLHVHADRDWEVCLVAAGEIQLHVAGCLHNLTAGEVVVIRPNEPHMLVACAGKRWVLMFRESLLRELPGNVWPNSRGELQVEGVALPRRLHVSDVRRNALVRVFRDLSDECARRHPMKHAMCITLLAEVLLTLGRAVPAARTPERVRVPAAARQVVLDLCAEVEDDPGRAWTVEELSRRSGYGATRLTSLFRAVKGTPPGHWLYEQRIRYGRELLSDSDRSVEEIALAVGFGSRSQFHRVFREFTGVTPGRYRAIQRQT